MTLTPTRTVIEGSRNCSCHQTVESKPLQKNQHADYAVIEIRMTRTANKASSDIYTLGGWTRQVNEKKEKRGLPFH